ncbi:hypothetical protein GF361_05980 [Candidatus Woesearchaeota archaeon]|nr:hypothetical protein [Candidatus Woesearchaeota archaeon]
MAIIGFNFEKIDAERKKDSVKGKIDIKNNVAVTNISKKDIKTGSNSQKVARITFDFNVNYEPKIGSMKFTGNILYLSESDKIDGLVKEFEKTKKVNQEVMPVVLNNILNRCNIQAIILSQQINLPSPVPMPKVNISNKKAQEKKQKK